ncbi:type II secretion system protein GspM [Roseivivax marinus]|uniref:type II secretion system protein GspM n=1 Tax=Roseivivax marinus TaxID=1379903 RepID=UPI00273F60E9|nr:type II secretion system protein GspM [Roseivivax marinus]
MIDALTRLGRRELWLVALLVLGVLPVAVAVGGVLPLIEARRAAEAQLAETRRLDDWVRARAADAASLAGGPTLDEAREPIGLAGLERSLQAAALREQVRELSNDGSGGIVLGFEAVPFAALAAWLDTSDPHWGYDVAEMRIDRTDAPGVVSADLRLLPQG